MPLNEQSKLGLANRFFLKIDNDYDLGSWSKVEGLEVKWDNCEYRAGDAGNSTWNFPGKTTYTPVKLSRAAETKDSAQVKKWLDETSFKHKVQQTGNIELRDSANEKVLSWDLTNIMPVKWSVTGFDAGASKVAVETLVLNHFGFLDDSVK